MRKLLLLIPVGLFAMTGVFWVAMNPTGDIPSTTTVSLNEQELFGQSETSLRQIIRRGDSQSIDVLNKSLDSLSSRLAQRTPNDPSIQKIDAMLISYRRDATVLTEKITPHMPMLQQSTRYENENEEKFLTAIDQIGLYELLTAYREMDKQRKNYIKDPNEETKTRYVTESERIRTIITELYLDENMEKPLFDYLDNHKNYFDTITAAYRDIGYTRVNRLRANGYAIRSAFQLLPMS